MPSQFVGGHGPKHHAEATHVDAPELLDAVKADDFL